MELDTLAQANDVSGVIRGDVTCGQVKLDLHVGVPAEQARIQQGREVVRRISRHGDRVQPNRVGVCTDDERAATLGAAGLGVGQRPQCCQRAAADRQTQETAPLQALRCKNSDLIGRSCRICSSCHRASFQGWGQTRPGHTQHSIIAMGLPSDAPQHVSQYETEPPPHAMDGAGTESVLPSKWQQPPDPQGAHRHDPHRHRWFSA